MKKEINIKDYIIILIIILLLIITINGVLSFNINSSYMFKNQYGDDIKLFGFGIYKYDSYFKAPIFIGTDLVMLLVVVPMTILAVVKEIKNRNTKTKLILMSLIGTILYYSASIVFGVTYNKLFLAYLALFSSSLFSLIMMLLDFDYKKIPIKQIQNEKGTKIFLIVTALALIVAWLPDIIPTMFSNKTLSLIEVYTTEITYVLDMAIISPLLFICLYNINNKKEIGYIILVIMLKLCVIIGIILPVQTLFQLSANIELPIAVLITKVLIFILLALFASYFNSKFYKSFK